jgi:hypothetical protein
MEVTPFFPFTGIDKWKWPRCAMMATVSAKQDFVVNCIHKTSRFCRAIKSKLSENLTV